MTTTGVGVMTTTPLPKLSELPAGVDMVFGLSFLHTLETILVLKRPAITIPTRTALRIAIPTMAPTLKGSVLGQELDGVMPPPSQQARLS